MDLAQHLDTFYRENHLPENGGYDDRSFEMKFGVFRITLPNPEFRRRVIHIHDLHHILNECDTSWKGEGVIAGWEMATEMWRYFPVNLLSLWAMAYSFWLHPKAVYQGFIKGTKHKDIIGLGYSRTALLNMELGSLKEKIVKENPPSPFIANLSFFFWLLVSQLFLFSPFLILFFALRWFLG